MDTPVKAKPKIKLYGFNNLTKTLSFNIYDICYTRTEEEKKQYIQYIDEVYNADRLTAILTEVSRIIGANILNVAKQDYDPQGASVTILISEEEIEKEDVVMHLDKSHLTVHTYPESHPHKCPPGQRLPPARTAQPAGCAALPAGRHTTALTAGFLPASAPAARRGRWPAGSRRPRYA